MAHRELLECWAWVRRDVWKRSKKAIGACRRASTQLIADQAALHNGGRKEFEMVWGELEHYLKGFSVYGKREMGCGLGFAQDMPRTLLAKHTTQDS